MPTSVRVIRVVNNEYTVEIETEVEDIEELFDTLTKTPWGRKVAHLLAEMLPDIPEYKPPSMKEEAEAEERRIKEYEEKLRKEGADAKLKELREKFGEDFDKIEENIQKKIQEVREIYLDYIRKKQGRSSKRPSCFLKYWKRIYNARKRVGGDQGMYSGMQRLALIMNECNKCDFKAECMQKSKKKQ